jgi:hypothetical protein
MSSCTTIDFIRSYRVFGMAVFDWVSTILSVLFLRWYFPSIVVWSYSPFMIVVGVVAFVVSIHYLTGTPTMLNYYIGLSSKPETNACSE